MDAGTLELVELDNALDFDHTPECERVGGCPSPASWVAASSCCNEQAYACDIHHAEMVRWLAGQPWGFSCRLCHTKNPKIIWTQIR